MAAVLAVVVSYNSRDHLRRCVTPLAEHGGVDVVVVDNASSDASLEAVADLPVRTIALGTNAGFAHGCNVGWRSGDAPVVLLVNPDAALDAASLDALVAVLAADERVGLVAPRIVGEDGALHHSLRRFPRLRSTYAQALFLHRLFPRASWADELVRAEEAYGRPGSPEWASGACMLVRRRALEEVGGLDEGFFLYSEDTDLCRRLRDGGWDIRYEPSAVAVHAGGASAPRTSLLPVLGESRIRYADKHEGRVRALLERGGVALGALTHTAVARGGLAARRGHLRTLRRALAPPSRTARGR